MTPFDLTPAARLDGLSPYEPPELPGSYVLRLDANEGRAHPGLPNAEALRWYPRSDSLEARLAAHWQVTPDQVVVTNGGDDAIDRVCRSFISEGDAAVVHAPTFEMIPRGIQLAGGTTDAVPWLGGAFPADAFCDKIRPGVRLVALVTPNNPTGGEIDLAAIEQVAQKAASVGAVLLVDLAYVEFADRDPQSHLLEMGNVVTIRTFSKAYGLAGIRVGYALSNASIALMLRTAGGPFPVSSGSLDIAMDAFARGPDSSFVSSVIRERRELIALFRSLGIDTLDSAANFVLARVHNAQEFQSNLLSKGVSVRCFSRSRAELDDRIRITLPGSAPEFEQLCKAIRSTRSPQPEQDLSHEHAQPSEPTMTQETGRTSRITRETKETKIEAKLSLDEASPPKIQTGLAFFDHMLTALATHARISLELTCRGDLQVDDHHTIEDCAIVLGQAIDACLGDRAGIQRFGSAYAPLDESLARVVIDLSGRASSVIELQLTRDSIGPVATENLKHFFQTIAANAKLAIHVDVLRGDNDHHKAESAFKAFALAFRDAIAISGQSGVPSTKGVL